MMLTFYLLRLVFDLLSLGGSLYVSEAVVASKGASVRNAILTSLLVTLLSRGYEFVLPPLVIGILFILTLGFFVHRFYGDEWIIILAIALSLSFAFMLLINSTMAVIQGSRY